MDITRPWPGTTEDDLVDLDVFPVYIDGPSEEEDALWAEIIRELGLDEPHSPGTGVDGLAPTASEDGTSGTVLRDADTTTEPPQTRDQAQQTDGSPLGAIETDHGADAQPQGHGHDHRPPRRGHLRLNLRFTAQIRETGLRRGGLWELAGWGVALVLAALICRALL